MSKRFLITFILIVLVSQSSVIELMAINSGLQNDEALNQISDITSHNLERSNPSFGIFTENLGQWDPEILFMSTTTFGRVGLGIGCVFYDLTEDTQTLINYETSSINRICVTPPPSKLNGTLLKLTFRDANIVEPTGEEPLTHKNNYFYGNESSKWVIGVSNYLRVVYKNIWDGIDLYYYFNENGFKYEFTLKPGADPKSIKIGVAGHSCMKVENNILIIETPNGNQLMDIGLKIFYDNDLDSMINGAFKTTNENQISFELGEYDLTRRIVIDPLLYSTFIGGSKDESGYRIAVDKSECAYITGQTASSDFPLIPGAYQISYSGGSSDVYVCKLNPTGSELIYSTYIGGYEEDNCWDIDIDSTGEIYLVGWTKSTDFPTTSNVYSSTHQGDYDIFVLKLNFDGSALTYSTFVGGTYRELGSGISVNKYNYAYVVGYSYSTDFPTTEGAYDNNFHGSSDLVVFKLDPSGSDLAFSTYIGGIGQDYGDDIEVDSSGNSFILGESWSTDFPTTYDCYDATFNGGYGDIIVLKLNPSGSDLLYSTFVGGSSGEYNGELVLDNSGNVFVTGETFSSDFPTTENAFDRSHNGGYSDIFTFKLNPYGSLLKYSTYIGGDGNDAGRSITLDSSGNTVITGSTRSSDFPVTDGAHDNSFNGNFDAFVLKLNPQGSSILYCSYFGGGEDDGAYDVILDSKNFAYLTGGTKSSNFTTTEDAYDISENGLNDIFVIKFSLKDTPTYPQNLRAATGNSFVYLTWQKPSYGGKSGITGYKIYRGNNISDQNLIKTIDNILFYNDTDVINGQIYYYWVRAVNNEGDGALSDFVNATPLSVPDPPKNFQAIPEVGLINLSWEIPDNKGGANITEYRIYKNILNDQNELLKTVGGSRLNFKDTVIDLGTTYEYYIVSVNIIGESKPSRIQKVTSLDLPTAPTNFQIIPGNAYVDLSWAKPEFDGGAEILEYNIYKSTTSGHKNYLKSLPFINSTFRDTEVTNGIIYYYQLSALNAVGESELSVELQAKPQFHPSPPRNLQTTVVEGYILLTWEVPSEDGGAHIINYNIYKGTEFGNWDLFKTVDANTTYYHDKKVENGKRYYYYVTALNDNGESRRSNDIDTEAKTEEPMSKLFGIDFLIIVLIISIIIILIAIFLIMKKRKSATHKKSTPQPQPGPYPPGGIPHRPHPIIDRQITLQQYSPTTEITYRPTQVTELQKAQYQQFSGQQYLSRPPEHIQPASIQHPQQVPQQVPQQQVPVPPFRQEKYSPPQKPKQDYY